MARVALCSGRSAILDPAAGVTRLAHVRYLLRSKAAAPERRNDSTGADQGSTFASGHFTHALLDHEIEISMDGYGRCHDDIFNERLWWTVRQEWVYLRPAAKGLSKSAVSLNSSTGTTGGGHIKRSAGGRQTRPISARLRQLCRRPPRAMTDRCCGFVDSRLRRYPPDRAIAGPPWTSRGKRPAFLPHLAHRSAAVHTSWVAGKKE